MTLTPWATTEGHLKLYLDDVRPCPEGWVLAHDCPEAMDILLKHFGTFEVSLDHDLGEDENGKEKQNGCTLILWFNAMQIFPTKVQLHTANPVGRRRMLSMLQDYGIFHAV